jgi:DNA-binding response OmpR family regulator
MATNRVFLGHGEIADIQPGSYKILSYLYEQRPRLCTRSELFYKAYRGLSYEPNTHDDPGWESTKDWGSLIDTLLWRLRKTLEPDPSNPRYIISKRGQGVWLDNVW